MKKLAIFVLLIIGLPFISCKQQQHVVQTQQEPSQKLQAQTYKIWVETLFPYSFGDPLNVLNSKGIILEGDYFEPVYIFQDGKVKQVDTIYPVARNVPELSLGEILSIKKNSSGHIQEVNVSFSREEVTFTFNFQLKNDGSFTLNGNAKLFVGGKEYKVLAKTTGGECLLLVDFSHEQFIIPDSKSAEGIQVYGTKVVKVKK